MNALAGKVAVVTGASRGIGKQTSLLLAAEGATVVLAARTDAPRPGTPGTLGETADAIRAVGPQPLVVRADLSVPADLDRLVDTTLDTLGRCDILVNNAGYTVGRTIYTLVPEIGREQWDKLFAINVTAPLMLIQGFWEALQAADGGVVVNISSGAAELSDELAAPAGHDFPENGPAYGASKAALNRMTNVIARHGLADRIALIAMKPGYVMTETMAATFARQGIEDSTAIDAAIPAKAVHHLCTCADPMQYSGQVIDGPALVEALGL